jgi:hypothetical protein
MEEFEIPCAFVKLPEFAVIPSDELKDARYFNSYVWEVPEFGRKKWAIVGYIDVNFHEHLLEGHSEEDIVKGCIRYLNKPPPRKKYQRRVKNPLYGNLDETPHKFKFRPESKFKQPVIEVVLLTDKRKNRRLWGEGQNIGFKGLKKLGRPKKKG